MKDIYDIKDILLGFPIDVIYSLIFVFFIFFLLIVYKFLLLQNDKEIIGEKKSMELKKEEKIDYLFILDDFEKKYLDSKNEVFYSKLLEILRKILEEKENKNISKMTFDEIKGLNLNLDLNNLIKSIYFKEYSKNIEDNEIIRKDFISKIRILAK